MANATAGILREVRKMVKHPGSCPSDRELLERFLQHRDEAAFTDLVHRHGTLVLGVCHRVLGQAQDAEDAFQATFLLLAQKAGSVRKQESLASWLFGVAQRVAGNVKIAAARRRRHEARAAVSDAQETCDDVTWREVKAVLDEELGRMPERYKAPLLLCYQEGKTQDEAARLLDWTPGTLRGRVDRGRELLKQRLTRRGLSLSIGLFAAVLSQPPASAVTALLRKSTVRAVLHYTAGKTGETLSSEVVALVQETLPAMVRFKGRKGIAVLLAMTMIGAGLLAHQPLTSNDKNKDPFNQATDPVTVIPDNKKPVRMDRVDDPLSAEAFARLGTLRFRHSGWVYSVVSLPNGKLLAASSTDNALRVWDANTGTELCRCRCRVDHPLAVALSPDGKTLASGGSDAIIRVWDVATGNELQQWKCGQPVFCIAFSPDGRTLASGSANKMVCLWDPSTGRKMRSLEGHEGRISSLAFSPDGKLLASGGHEDKAICLWEVASGREVNRLGEEKNDVFVILFATGGKSLFTAGEHGPIHLWETSTGKELKQFEGHKEYVQELAAHKPEGAAEALLEYLPFAEDEDLAAEVRTALAAVAFRAGNLEPAVLRALKDKHPLRRAAAAEAICQPAGLPHLAQVKELLHDQEPTVRVRAALALAGALDRDALPALIDQLAELPLEQGSQAEEFLRSLAGPDAPQVVLEETARARTACREAWRRWYQEKGPAIHLVKPSSQHTLGYTMLVYEHPEGTCTIVELDRVQRPRWELSTACKLLAVQVLPGGRVLIADQQNVVSERDLKGKILWQKRCSAQPVSCQRLPNGNTFIATRNQLLVVDRTGKEVVAYSPVPGGAIKAGQRFKNGQMAIVTNQGQYLRLDASGKVIKTGQAGRHNVWYWSNFSILPNDHFLCVHGESEVVEYDGDGKAVWKAKVPSTQILSSAARLSNGNTLVASFQAKKVFEINRAGEEISEYQCPSRPFRVYER
jgi:RNA polymerase sigma factor (sigma-70 family)